MAKGGAEMTVTGKAEIEAQGSKIVVLREKIERTSKAQTQLVAIQRQALDLLEDLREINRRAADFGGDFSEGPTTR